ncbi:MAG: hypothetical protein LC633_03120, partial [Desulfobulbaceae bacterium]|nr:hypothetical protein [Desulfobulbaceae bacterium]
GYSPSGGAGFDGACFMGAAPLFINSNVTIQQHSIFAHSGLLEYRKYASKSRMNKSEALLNSYDLGVIVPAGH